MNRQRDGQRAFGIFEAVAFVSRNLEVVSDGIELLARHAESRMVVDFHERALTRRRRGWKIEDGGWKFTFVPSSILYPLSVTAMTRLNCNGERHVGRQRNLSEFAGRKHLRRPAVC